jgi:hypothetical protein
MSKTSIVEETKMDLESSNTKSRSLLAPVAAVNSGAVKESWNSSPSSLPLLVPLWLTSCTIAALSLG